MRDADSPAGTADVLQGPSKPLDVDARAVLEPRFGRDFSHVRVHSDTAAAELATAVGARAFTVGSHLVFGPGQYVPGSPEGRRLLAHELTHVVQQTGRPAVARPAVGPPDDRAEREADRIASRALDGGTSGRGPGAVLAPTADTAPVLRRKPAAQAPPGRTSPPPKLYDLLSVPDLVVQIERLLDEGAAEVVEAAKGEKEKQAVMWLNGYNVHDIAQALGLLRTHRKLDRLKPYAAVRPLVDVAIKAVENRFAVDDRDLEKVHPAQRAEFRAQFHIVEDSFLPALDRVCQEIGCRPEDLLAAMLSENGLRVDNPDPRSHAVGLIQFMPDTLRRLGYSGAPADFARLSATDQMDYVRRFFQSGRGKLTSAGRIHQFMFLPGSMEAARAPGDVVSSRGDEFYSGNASLDVNGDGTITVEELTVGTARHVPEARRVLATLRSRSRARMPVTELPAIGPPQ